MHCGAMSQGKDQQTLKLTSEFDEDQAIDPPPSINRQLLIADDMVVASGDRNATLRRLPNTSRNV